MNIKRIVFDKYKKEVLRFTEGTEVRLSFYFGEENWHLQLKKNATKHELRDCFLNLAKLIEESDKELKEIDK